MLEVKCNTCLYNKNCQFLATHSGENVSGCTVYKNSADMVEVKHATWIENYDGETVCSNCHSEAGIDAWEMEMRDKKRYDKSPYCPQCGAKMDGRE